MMVYDEDGDGPIWAKITDEQSEMKERILDELEKCEYISDAVNMISFVMAEFIARTATDRENARLTVFWLSACVLGTLEKWDEEETCNWNGTRQ